MTAEPQLRDLSITYTGERRVKTPHGELAFGAPRSASFPQQGTSAQRRAAYDDWAERLRYAERCARGY